MAAAKRNAAENGTVGTRVKALQEAHPGFSAQAFAKAYHFWKMDPGKRAHELRAFDLYRDMLGLDEQGDLEDVIASRNTDADGNDTRTPIEQVMDGRPQAAAMAQAMGKVDSPLAGIPRDQWRPDLIKFAEGIADVDADQVNRALDRFTTDYPELADQALELAQDRLIDLNRSGSGGEPDLRPPHLQNAPLAEAEQTAKSNVTPIKGPRGGRKPAADKAAQASAH
jgi:hypothetical protein